MLTSVVLSADTSRDDFIVVVVGGPTLQGDIRTCELVISGVTSRLSRIISRVSGYQPLSNKLSHLYPDLADSLPPV